MIDCAGAKISEAELVEVSEYQRHYILSSNSVCCIVLFLVIHSECYAVVGIIF